jgi:hypothetical protein
MEPVEPVTGLRTTGGAQERVALQWMAEGVDTASRRAGIRDGWGRRMLIAYIGAKARREQRLLSNRPQARVRDGRSVDDMPEGK